MSGDAKIKQPFSNAQLELLKLFGTDVSEEELQELRRILAAFKLQKATTVADAVWEKENWTDANVDSILQEHSRFPAKDDKSANR